MAGAKPFEIDDAKSFDENLAAFSAEIEVLDPVLGAALNSHLKGLAAGTVASPAVWDALHAAAEKQELEAKATAATPPAVEAKP